MAVPGTAFSGHWRRAKVPRKSGAYPRLGWRSVPDPKAIVEGRQSVCGGAARAACAICRDDRACRAWRSTVERLKDGTGRRASSPLDLSAVPGLGQRVLVEGGFPGYGQRGLPKDSAGRAGHRQVDSRGVLFPKTRRVVFHWRATVYPSGVGSLTVRSSNGTWLRFYTLNL